MAGSLAIVIVTHERADLLRGLLASIELMTPSPDLVVIVDNASTDATPTLVQSWVTDHPELKPISVRNDTNRGGSGGFHDGVRTALAAGADWCWLMDDDVAVLPDALARLRPWMQRFQVLHGRRYDADGTPFYWQARFQRRLGIPLPYSLDRFNSEGYELTDSGTFEGMLVAASVIEKIGLPDPRFFVCWDDATYAWLAARSTDVAYVNEFVLRRTRRQRQASLIVRPLRESSALMKFHMMRNRAYLGRYFDAHGELHRSWFGVGTALTFAKEVVRLVLVEHSLRGFGALVRGTRAGRAIWADRDWAPMPPLR